MRKYGYGINSYHKTASVYVDIAPFYIFWLSDVVTFICDYIPSIPLPKIPFRLWNKDSIEFNDGKKWAKLGEWYGDLDSVFCCHIHHPVENFCWGKIDERCIKVDYDEVKKVFRDLDKELWDRQEEIAQDVENDENENLV